MNIDSRFSFAFLVLMYNQEDYILEHLESIKYLIQTYGRGIDVDVILSDDCSMDQTRNMADNWLRINGTLFRHVKTLYNPKNLGTCASVNNMLTYMVADRCKLTAGDDVYSYENIFELTKYDSDIAIVSGRTLYLLGDRLEFDRRSNTLAAATQAIYQNNSLLHRFKHFSYNNAPNILYATECLLHPKVRAYLRCFDVTEDWPLQIAIARQFSNRGFKLINEVLVYYRRTAGSTYIVANHRFVKDKNLLYDDLIQQEINWIEKLRLRNRKFCFKTQNRFFNKILNLDFYLFVISASIIFTKILQNFSKDYHIIKRHQIHFSRIKYLARSLKF